MAETSGILIKIRNVLRGVVLAGPWVIWLGVADLCLSLLLPGTLLNQNVVYDLSSSVAYSVWRSIQYIFENANGARIAISGDKLPIGESAIVLCNHVGWCDFYMIQALAIKAGMLSRQRYFAKVQLRWVPFLGWGLWAMGFPLISRNWLKDRSELEKVFGGIVNQRWPTWLVSFAEGTRYNSDKYLESEAWCREHNRVQPKNLLYPRTKGFIATVKELRKAPHVKAVYILTVAYRRHSVFQKAPTMWETLSVPSLTDNAGYQFHVHARRFPLEELPYSDDGLAKWLEEKWVEGGEWLETMRVDWKP